jgi:hypothetical protein
VAGVGVSGGVGGGCEDVGVGEERGSGETIRGEE